MISPAMDCNFPSAAEAALPSLVERLALCAELWTAANSASLARLGRSVVNDGGFFSRVEVSASTTTATLERFARFLIEPANWPEGMVPQEVCLFAHAVGVSGGACPASPDIAGENIAQPVPELIGAALPIGTSGRPAAHIAAGPAVTDAAPGFPPKAVAGAAGDPALPSGSAA